MAFQPSKQFRGGWLYFIGIIDFIDYPPPTTLLWLEWNFKDSQETWARTGNEVKPMVKARDLCIFPVKQEGQLKRKESLLPPVTNRAGMRKMKRENATCPKRNASITNTKISVEQTDQKISPL